jgi:hypothetical protein
MEEVVGKIITDALKAGLQKSITNSIETTLSTKLKEFSDQLFKMVDERMSEAEIHILAEAEKHTESLINEYGKRERSEWSVETEAALKAAQASHDSLKRARDRKNLVEIQQMIYKKVNESIDEIARIERAKKT